MTDRKKNLLVGVVVIIGLTLLGWMVLQFGNVIILPFTNGRTAVTVITDRADGIGEGSAVLYRGVQVGQVRKIRMADDLAHIVLTVQLDSDIRVPANVEAVIRPQGLIGGGASVYLEVVGPAPMGRLMGGSELAGHVGNLQLLPKEFTDLADDMRKTSQSFRESGVIKHMDEAVLNISEQATKVGEVLQSVQKIVGDPKLKSNIEQSLENISEATATARKIATNLEKFSASMDRTGEQMDRLAGEATDTIRDARGSIKSASTNIDQISRQIADRLTQTSGLLETMNSVTRKVDQGKGTAGLLVNDPKLYEALVDSAKQLNLTLTDLKRLVQQWEQEGVTLKVN